MGTLETCLSRALTIMVVPMISELGKLTADWDLLILS